MTWPFLIALVLALVAWLLFGKVRPIYYRHQRLLDLNRFTRMALESGGNGGVLLVQHEASDKFLQFTKRGDSRNTRYLRFGFPDAPWSRQYYPALRARFESDHILFAETPTGEPGVTRFLVVDLLDAEAAAVVGQITADVMGIGSEQFTIHYDGPAPSSTETREIFKEARKAMKRRSHRDDVRN